MIAALIKSTLLIAVAAGFVWLLRRKSAAIRHAIWTAGLIGAMAVPLSSLLLPSWHAPLLGAAETWVETTAVPEIGRLFQEESSPTSTGAEPGGVQLREVARKIWLVGTGVALLVLFAGAFRLGVVVVRSRPFPDSRWNRIANEVSEVFELSRPVQLLENQRVAFLGTWGIFRPRVLVPSSAVDWSEDRIRMVLGHELAHIKRHDWVIQVLAEAARAIYWFNPMFWLAHNQIRRESEYACDDWVLRMGAVGPEYAEELLEVTRALRRGSTFRSPILAMTQPSHLERRLVALLNPSVNRLAATPWAVIVVVGAAVAVTLPLASISGPDQTLEANRQREDPSGPGSGDDDVRLVSGDSQAVKSKSDSIGRPQGKDSANQSTAIAANRPKKKPARSCQPTPSVRRTRTVPIKLSAFGGGPWHISADSLIWVWDQPYVAGKEINTVWLRPPETELAITGKRLDGASPPLEVKASSDFQAGYIATPLIFPKAGCWRITAVAGNSKLTFITEVKSSGK